MKKMFIGVLMLMLLPLAATAAELKIGFVNIERLLRDSLPATRASKKLEKEFSARELEIQKQLKQFKDLQTLLVKENVTMSEAERRNKERDLANLNRDLQRGQREAREDYNTRQNEERVIFQERVNKVIHDMAEREKFDVILFDAIYVSPRADVTDKVLRLLADK